MAKQKIYLAKKSDLIFFCTLTKSNNVYSCDKTPQEIYEAFTAGTQVYIDYMGVKVPVANAVYNEQDDEYYINATITTVVGEELLGRQIGFDGTTWSIDFNDSFIVRGAGSLANIGKYLKATANGVEWDTPAGGGGGNASALEPEEMLELLMDPELNVGGSENEPMANVYGVEENGEMVALGYTETVNNVSTDYILVF